MHLHHRTFVRKLGPLRAPVAQLDRASDYGSEGSRFNSLRVRHSAANSCVSLRGNRFYHDQFGGRLTAVDQGNDAFAFKKGEEFIISEEFQRTSNGIVGRN